MIVRQLILSTNNSERLLSPNPESWMENFMAARKVGKDMILVSIGSSTSMTGAIWPPFSVNKLRTLKVTWRWESTIPSVSLNPTAQIWMPRELLKDIAEFTTNSSVAGATGLLAVSRVEIKKLSSKLKMACLTWNTSRWTNPRKRVARTGHFAFSTLFSLVQPFSVSFFHGSGHSAITFSLMHWDG